MRMQPITRPLSAMLASFCVLCPPCPLNSLAQTASASQTIVINAAGPTTPLPHFWEQTFGSGRAILSLRDSYRKDIDTVHAATGFRSVRAHGIFMDEVGLYDPERELRNPGLAAQKLDTDGAYNFSYIDQIYDGLLEHHVQPFVELSFMPRGLAADPNLKQAFWYQPVVSPPKSYQQWDAMIHALALHLIERYGIDELAQWNFEVWNEPNLDFWGGNPRQPTYWELYDHTARALKGVNRRLRIGGPATAQAAWVGAFLQHCKDKNIPVDFASTHVYGNDTADNVLGTSENIPRDRMVPRAVRKVHEEILKSPFPKMPLYFSEYNASYSNEPDVTDSVYMGPWLATTIAQCDGMVQSMAYWSFSDVFEEQGVVRTPFYGGFGLVAADNIPKPALNAFRMLHQLGDRRLTVASDSVLATRRGDGALVLAVWNYAPPYGEGANYTPPPPQLPPATQFSLQLNGVPANTTATLQRLDGTHGNVVALFDRMGRPAWPSRDQIAQLRAAGQPAPEESAALSGNTLTLSIPAQGLVLVTILTRTGQR